MEKYDYLLYDNRTRSSLGRDWGLKAATGVLQTRVDLRDRFYDYCSASFDTSRGPLKSFGHAIGGLPDPSRRGYLLCVTLEDRDPVDRPTCVLLGIWLPSRDDVRHFLEHGDPVASAREITRSSAPPEQLTAIEAESGHPKPVPADAVPLTANPNGQPILKPFRPGETPSRVMGLLRSQTTRGIPSLSILGITALTASDRLRSAQIELAFCLPPDASSRRALRGHLDRQTAVGTTAGAAATSNRRSGSKLSLGWRWALGNIKRLYRAGKTSEKKIL